MRIWALTRFLDRLIASLEVSPKLLSVPRFGTISQTSAAAGYPIMGDPHPIFPHATPALGYASRYGQKWTGSDIHGIGWSLHSGRSI